MRVEKLTNGFTVEIPDAKAQKNNKDPKKPYVDPWKEYGFATADEALAFIKQHFSTLEPPADDYATSFARATSEDD
jgi:hypothetical protein